MCCVGGYVWLAILDFRKTVSVVMVLVWYGYLNSVGGLGLWGWGGGLGGILNK